MTDFQMRAPQAGTVIRGTPGEVLTALPNGITGFRPAAVTPSAPPWVNVLWVNAAALVAGDGSEGIPFQTITEAVAAAPVGEGTAIMVGPGDYSAEAQVVIADQDISFIGLGGAETGASSPPARPILPDLLFDVSIDPLVFFAVRCELGTCEVATPVAATLEDCSSVWDDTGGDATVRASGSPTPFGAPPAQTISGTVGGATLVGMRIFQGLTATGSIATYDCLMTNGGGGLVAGNSIVCKNGEFGASAILTALAIFLDQWSFFQAVEQLVALSVTPRVQELSPLQYQWGAANANDGEFLNPNILFGTSAATAATDFHATSRGELPTRIEAQIATAHANDIVCTLWTGATLGALAATSLQVTIPAGQRFASFDVVPPLFVAEGAFKAVKFNSGSNVAANPLWVTVICN